MLVQTPLATIGSLPQVRILGQNSSGQIAALCAPEATESAIITGDARKALAVGRCPR